MADQNQAAAVNENNLTVNEDSLNQDEGEAISEAESDNEEETDDKESSSIESEEEEEPHEHLDENDVDNEQEQEMYQEYLHLVNEIDEQNANILNIKILLNNLKCQPCLTLRDMKECRRLAICQDQEHIKLRYMINRAIQLQNFGSRRHYDDLKWEITDAEQENFLYGSQMNVIKCSSPDCVSNARAFVQLDTDSDDDYD